MGEVGPEAWRWLQILGEAGVSAWIIPGGLDAVMKLSFDLLFHDGALLGEDMNLLPTFDEREMDTDAVLEVRSAFLELAARRFLAQCNASPLLRHAIDRFCDQEAVWLDDYALFEALQKETDEQDWRKWPSGLAERDPAALDEAMVSLAAEVEERKALHYLMNRQVGRLQARAETEGVKLIMAPPTPAVAQWAPTAAAAIEPVTCGVDARMIFGIDAEQQSWRFTWSDVTPEVLDRLIRGRSSGLS
jgi:4-alpha-glucanotransferase